MEPWRVTLIDTGEATQTGGRLKRVLPYVGDEEFLFTYGDGVADVDLRALTDFHHEHGTLATVTAVQPRGRWGSPSAGCASLLPTPGMLRGLCAQGAPLPSSPGSPSTRSSNVLM